MKTRRVLIVGTKFGELYLNAFIEPRSGFELVGILAQGSERSQQLALAFNVPLFLSINDLPDDIDIACVVIRAEVVGGKGSDITEALLRRGIHVVQEHPLSPAEVRSHQALAKQQGVTYWVNSFYTMCRAGQSWLYAARQITTLTHPPVGGQLTTSRQLLFSALDLLLQAHGCPTEVCVTYQGTVGEVFHRLELSLPGSRILLFVQSYLDPQDPDMHNLVMHQMSLIWPTGYLTLEASFGPVIWTPVLHAPNHRSSSKSLYLTAEDPDGTYLQQPTSLLLCEATDRWQTAFECDGPAGVALMLNAISSHLDGGTEPAGCSPDYQFALAQLWQQVLRDIGEPSMCDLPVPEWIEPALLTLPRELHHDYSAFP